MCGVFVCARVRVCVRARVRECVLFGLAVKGHGLLPAGYQFWDPNFETCQVSRDHRGGGYIPDLKSDLSLRKYRFSTMGATYMSRKLFGCVFRLFRCLF